VVNCPYIMDTDISKEFATFLTSITAVLAGILGILKYFQYRTRRDKIMLVRQAFEGVVKSLASNVEVERMAGAILLRRLIPRSVFPAYPTGKKRLFGFAVFSTVKQMSTLLPHPSGKKPSMSQRLS
jgi:hypothetical protein